MIRLRPVLEQPWPPLAEGQLPGSWYCPVMPGGGARLLFSSLIRLRATAGSPEDLSMCFGCCIHSHVSCLAAAYGLPPFMDHLLSQRATSRVAPVIEGQAGLALSAGRRPRTRTSAESLIARQDASHAVDSRPQF